MLSDLLHWDRDWSLAINRWHSEWADSFMHTVSGVWIWVPLYVLLAGLIIYTYRKSSWVILVGIVLLVALVDWTSVHFFKDVFMRLRPSHEPSLEGLIRVPYSRGGLYGFISSHASNHFAIAAYISVALGRKYKLFRYGILYVWAALICYSRVYLGRHYVGDVVCGTLWGLLLAWGIWKLTCLVLAKVYPSTPQSLYRSPKK